MTAEQAGRLAEIVRKFMEQNGLNDTSFGALAGLYRGQAASIKRGMTRTMDVADFFKIAVAMGWKPEDLAKEIGIVLEP